MSLPNKNVIIGIIGALILATAVAIFIVLRMQAQQTKTAVVTGSVSQSTPIPDNTAITLTATPSLSRDITASQSTQFDIMLNTNGAKIDSFQFIAVLDGTSTPHILDSDNTTTGVQIQSINVPGLTTVTNSAIEQNGQSTIRFAMITQNSTQPYSSSSPIKIATIQLTPSIVGTLTITFDKQNSLATRTGTNQDSPLTTTGYAGAVLAASSTIPGPITQSNISTSSSKIAAKTVIATAPALPTSAPTLDPFTSSSISTPLPSPTSSPLVVASPLATPLSLTTDTAGATVPTTATTSALPKALPVSGNIENTIMLLLGGFGLLFVGLAFAIRV